MCGEHPQLTAGDVQKAGSSPHVRGALDLLSRLTSVPGIIPACAGSTHTMQALRSIPGDHPRMCGEHLVKQIESLRDEGSSPHVRGALCHRLAIGLPSGIIPACAGSTATKAGSALHSGDHPRMCGEHCAPSALRSVGEGSSPHVRGAQLLPRHNTIKHGIIPACAGSTHRQLLTRCRPRDHPRMCGEHTVTQLNKGMASGSSPHVRGSTSCPISMSAIGRDHPRMCGEHRILKCWAAPFMGSSPHVRGAPVCFT